METYDMEIFENLAKKERTDLINEIRNKFSNPDYNVVIGGTIIKNRDELFDWQIKNKYV